MRIFTQPSILLSEILTDATCSPVHVVAFASLLSTKEVATPSPPGSAFSNVHTISQAHSTHVATPFQNFEVAVLFFDIMFARRVVETPFIASTHLSILLFKINWTASSNLENGSFPACATISIIAAGSVYASFP